MYGPGDKYHLPNIVKNAKHGVNIRLGDGKAQFSHLFAGKLAMDEHGYLIIDERARTSVPGVFAAGEIADPIFRQIVTSAGSGCKAGMEAEKYLASLED